jgi:hypothetical protein
MTRVRAFTAPPLRPPSSVLADSCHYAEVLNGSRWEGRELVSLEDSTAHSNSPCFEYADRAVAAEGPETGWCHPVDSRWSYSHRPLSPAQEPTQWVAKVVT